MTAQSPSTKEPRILGKRILVAEDEPGVRDALALLLGLDDHIVIDASNGNEALALFQKQPFDVVITDYAMPWMKGDELAAAIKRLVPTQPVILISAYAETLVVCGNLRCVDAVLGKPFLLADLRRAIATVLGSH
jgi:two-component system capsular synthesis sensor histidine kinase RcsC